MVYIIDINTLCEEHYTAFGTFEVDSPKIAIKLDAKIIIANYMFYKVYKIKASNLFFRSTAKVIVYNIYHLYIFFYNVVIKQYDAILSGTINIDVLEKY